MVARRLAIRCTTGVAVGALLGVGCAYFNTLYNAKQKYADAAKAEDRATASQAAAGVSSTTGRNPQAAQYEDVIAKCKKLMATYPDSRHVDDAMLLSAKALYRLREYDQAVAAIDSLEARYPKTELLDDARFLKGKALVAAKKYEPAVTVLRDYADAFRKHDDRPEGLYLLCTSLMQLGSSEDAVRALERLEKDHGRSNYRFRAQVDMAEILAQKELYDQSLDVYRRMSESRIPEAVRFDVLTGMARVQEHLGDYASAQETLSRIERVPPGADNEPKLALLRARAHAGVDSTAKAIRAYKDMTRRFSRGVYGAEAYFRLGELYESIDSLESAQTSYSEVPRAYSGSTYAEEAIRRSSNISRVLRLQQTSGDDSPEAIAMRTFSMAEIQYFQFNNPQKAIPNYEKIVVDYPASEFAPRAVYALGYLNGVVLGDTAKAREWYDVLRTRYPDSPQALLAYAFYKGAPPPPPYSELIKTATAVSPASSQAPQTRREPPPRREPPRPAGADTARTAPPPSPPADTSRAPADTTRGPR